MDKDRQEEWRRGGKKTADVKERGWSSVESEGDKQGREKWEEKSERL